MKKRRLFWVLLVLVLSLNGCSQPNIQTNTTAPSSSNFVEINNKSISISEINEGLKDTFNTTLYYHENGQLHTFLNRTVEYELFYISNSKTGPQTQVSAIITNIEHPLSTEQNPLLYKFNIHITENGLQSYFCEQSHIPVQEDHSSFVEGASYLGSYSMCINEIEQPKHEAMSSQWKKQAEKALQLYMDRNDFYSEKEQNLPKGKYNVYIQGFSKSDVDSIVIFEHEDGQVYLGQYYFVHDIPNGESADLNHVELISSTDGDFIKYLGRLKQNAAFCMEYST